MRASWKMWIWMSCKRASGCDIHFEGTVGTVTNCAEGHFNVPDERMANLVVLHLDGNNLVSLPDRFVDLPNLEELYLNKTNLKSLSANAFQGLPKLTKLYLDHNLLKSLQAGVFNGLQSLTLLHLDINGMESVSEGVFYGLSSLRTLELHSNRLKSLPEKVFDGLQNLKYLNLNQNRFKSLPANVFDGLQSLTHLHIGYNYIADLPANALSGLQSLSVLDLSHNSLKCLPENIFDELPSVQYLYLNRNQLGFLHSYSFANLHSLAYVNLGSNMFTGLPCAVFNIPESLRELKLMDNPFTTNLTLPDRLCKVTKLSKDSVPTCQHADVFSTCERHVNCAWNVWQPASPCSASCGTGEQLWTRQVSLEPNGYWMQCMSESRSCNEDPCPESEPCRGCCMTFQVSNLRIRGRMHFDGLEFKYVDSNTYCVFFFNLTLSFSKFNNKQPDGLHDQNQLKIVADVIGSDNSSWTFSRNPQETDSNLYVHCLRYKPDYPEDDSVAFAMVPSTKFDNIGSYSHISPNFGSMDVLFDITCNEAKSLR